MAFGIPTRGPASLQSALGLLLSFALSCKGLCCLSECPRVFARLCKAHIEPCFPVEHHKAFAGLCDAQAGLCCLPECLTASAGLCWCPQVHGKGRVTNSSTSWPLPCESSAQCQFCSGAWLGQGCRWVGAFRLKPTGIFPMILKECWIGSYRKLPWLWVDNSVLTTACHLQPCRYLHTSCCWNSPGAVPRCLSWNNCFCSHSEQPPAFL